MNIVRKIRSHTRITQMGVAFVFLLISQNIAADSYKEIGFNCNDNKGNENCLDKCASNTINPFNVCLATPGTAYVVDWVKLGLRKGGTTSDFKTVGKRDKNMQNMRGVVFSFDETWVRVRLTITSTAAFQLNGFDARVKIKSSGTGSGMQDKSIIAKFRWDESQGKWYINSQANEDLSVPGKIWAQKGTAVVYRAKGSVNNVSIAAQGTYTDD